MMPTWNPAVRRRVRANLRRATATPKTPIYVHVIHRPLGQRFPDFDGNARWSYQIITDRFTPNLLTGTSSTRAGIYLRAWLAVRRYNKHAEYHVVNRTRRGT